MTTHTSRVTLPQDPLPLVRGVERSDGRRGWLVRLGVRDRDHLFTAGKPGIAYRSGGSPLAQSPHHDRIAIRNRLPTHLPAAAHLVLPCPLPSRPGPGSRTGREGTGENQVGRCGQVCGEPIADRDPVVMGRLCERRSSRPIRNTRLTGCKKVVPVPYAEPHEPAASAVAPFDAPYERQRILGESHPGRVGRHSC